MDQFKAGLEAGGILKYLKKHYDLLTPLFVNEVQLFTTSKYIIMKERTFCSLIPHNRHLQDYVHH